MPCGGEGITGGLREAWMVHLQEHDLDQLLNRPALGLPTVAPMGTRPRISGVTSSSKIIQFSLLS